MSVRVGPTPTGDPAPDAPPDIPWEERPAGKRGILWRSSRNPIIKRNHILRANSIFNSAVVRYGDGFAGVFRVDDTARVMNIHAGRSRDGIDWAIDPEPIGFTAADVRVPEIQEIFDHAYDPRVTWLEDRYYVTWCNGCWLADTTTSCRRRSPTSRWETSRTSCSRARLSSIATRTE